jgi:hypothetical protein
MYHWWVHVVQHSTFVLHDFAAFLPRDNKARRFFPITHGQTDHEILMHAFPSFSNVLLEDKGRLIYTAALCFMMQHDIDIGILSFTKPRGTSSTLGLRVGQRFSVKIFASARTYPRNTGCALKFTTSRKDWVYLRKLLHLNLICLSRDNSALEELSKARERGRSAGTEW